MDEEVADPTALPAETTVGRLALRVDDLERVLPFYRDVIGFEVDRRDSTAGLSVPGGSELLVLIEAPDAPPRPSSAAGLFHVAIRLPDRASLGALLRRLRNSDTRLSGASDHLVSEALYLRDPAGNGLELYRDRPRETWDRLDDGRAEMDTLPLDLGEILDDAGAGIDGDELPPGTDVGHVHLEVTDLAAATDFYVDGLGLRPSSQDVRGAKFLAAGDYHHHLGLNVWNRRTAPLGEGRGLAWFEFVLPDEASREAATGRLVAGGFRVGEDAGTRVVTDPDGIPVRLVTE